ncbi:MAG: hypothetical protein EXR79_05885 [Myxococcales bacterium]|nr:hypothetical protein [Myxococcales bacterium]
MDFRLALVVAGLAGFVALSYEILWFRVYAFATGASASGFGVLLGAYLAGVAFGSLGARRIGNVARGQVDDPRRALPGHLALVANVLAWAVIPCVAHSLKHVGFVVTLPLVALAAGVMGALLPVLSHLGIDPDARAGSRLSHLYLANIVGCALGSLGTGFVLLDRLALPHAALAIAGAGAGLALLLYTRLPLPRSLRLRGAALTLAGAVAIVALHGVAFDRVYERLQFKRSDHGERFAHIIETRSGVITVTQAGSIFGGGMYDGVFSTSLFPDRNRLARAYLLPALHPAPREVLMVGLASGSWAQVVAHLPGVARLTIVEINPGYLNLVGRYPQTASLLANPKVEIVIDDGRRWLNAHPERHFDLIVQNTTWHWRAQITGLLSREYLELLRARMLPGGVAYWNTTDSGHAQKTGCATYAHGLRYQNFVAVSDAPIVPDADRLHAALAGWEIDGVKVVDDTRWPGSAQQRDALVALVRGGVAAGGPDASIEGCASILARTQNDPVVTDDNMVVEFSRKWGQQPE